MLGGAERNRKMYGGSFFTCFIHLHPDLTKPSFQGGGLDPILCCTNNFLICFCFMMLLWMTLVRRHRISTGVTLDIYGNQTVVEQLPQMLSANWPIEFKF